MGVICNHGVRREEGGKGVKKRLEGWELGFWTRRKGKSDYGRETNGEKVG